MFKVDLDLLMYFVPPMDEHGQGIPLTRTLEVPFAPAPGLAICARHLTGFPDPEGVVLKDVAWDLDRQVFLATTKLTCYGTPIAQICDEIRLLVDLGWRMGSFKKAYEEQAEMEWSDSDDEFDDGDWEIEEEEEVERLPQMAPRGRPAEFNKLLRALVRTMAELHNNKPIAYAMDKTKRFYTEAQLKTDNSPGAKRFLDASREYDNMSFGEQLAWIRKVQRSHPRLDRIV